MHGKRSCSKLKQCLNFCPFIGLGILLFVIMWYSESTNNPDGSCTHPVFRMFDTKKEYDRAIRDGSPIATLHHIPTYDKRGFCLDGSAPAFYYRPGTAATKYQIYFEGGGFCFNYKDCSKRSQTKLGSSRTYKNYAWFNTEYLSTNQHMNPLSHNWNTLYIRQCDGMAYLANKRMITVFDKKRIYFEGFAILRNLMRFLFVEHNEFELNTATDIIISGASAGGMTILYHANYIWNEYIAKHNNQVHFMAVIESGYFRMVHDKTVNDLLWLYENMDVMDSLNAECVQYYSQTDVCFVGEDCEDQTDQMHQCLLLEHLMQFIDEDMKIFVMQSRFDFNYRNKDEAKRIEMYNKMGDAYAEYLLNEFLRINDSEKRMNRGAFISSCKHHCGEFNNIEIDEYVVSEAMFEFYYAKQNKTNRNLWFQNHKYKCQHCCLIAPFAVHDPAPVHGCSLSDQVYHQLMIFCSISQHR
eukprot:1052613_1